MFNVILITMWSVLCWILQFAFYYILDGLLLIKKISRLIITVQSLTN